MCEICEIRPYKIVHGGCHLPEGPALFVAPHALEGYDGYYGPGIVTIDNGVIYIRVVEPDAICANCGAPIGEDHA